ncbi:MAG TPA: ABC-2 family transporter protein [Micromonosporaceae bacterium]
MTMSGYLTLTRAEFRRYSRYRLAIAAGILSNCLFALLRGSVFTVAVAGAGGEIAGYDQSRATDFVWLGQALIVPIGLYGWYEVADRVRTGDIAVDFLRPTDLQLHFWAVDLGRAGFTLLSRGFPVAAIGVLVAGVTLPTNWASYALGALSLLLAVSVSYMCRLAVNLVAFWTANAGGYLSLYIIVLDLFSGFYLPVHIFPEWLRVISFCLPFPSMLQAPVDVISGRVTGLDAWWTVLIQVFWLFVTALLARMVLRLAGRSLVVQGG